jgi:hypothetical protein
VYDGVFEVLQWLLFLSGCPPVQLLKAWCVTVKVLPDISAISALTAVKHGSYIRSPAFNRYYQKTLIMVSMGKNSFQFIARIGGPTVLRI